MQIVVYQKPLCWSKDTILRCEMAQDWYGEKYQPPVRFGCAVDSERFWFMASHDEAAMSHPCARYGAFQAKLWKYDVVEFFLLDPVTGRYLEFNLSPSGAWWAAQFVAPRVQDCSVENPLASSVETFVFKEESGAWRVAAALSLEVLQERYHFGEGSCMNVTCILNSPRQRFLSATQLNAPQPDFHLPDQYPAVSFEHVGEEDTAMPSIEL